MMPLSSTDTQVIKLLNTPKLPASLFQNAQPLTITVLAADQKTATILLAGRQLQTQTNTPLTVGEQLKAQPSLVNGQLQLKILPPNDNDTTAAESTPEHLQHDTLPLTGQRLTSTITPSLVTTQQAQQTPTGTLPNWTNHLPDATKAALASLKNSLPNQLPLQQILQQLTDKRPELTDTNPNNPKTSEWQAFLKAMLTMTPSLTADKVQQSMLAFNAKLSNQPQPEWKQALQTLINTPSSDPDEKLIAQSLINKTEQTQQIQSLHHASGQAVWLQEIPIQSTHGLDNFTFEVDVPKPDLPEQDQHWKVFVQLALPIGDFTSRIQIDKALNLKVQLWGSNEQLAEQLHAQAPQLRKALSEQGLVIDSLIVAQGKPEPRTERPLWQQPLIDLHS